MLNIAFALHLQGSFCQFFLFAKHCYTKCATGSSTLLCSSKYQAISWAVLLQQQWIHVNSVRKSQLWKQVFSACSGSVGFEGAPNAPTAHCTQLPNYYMNHALHICPQFSHDQVLWLLTGARTRALTQTHGVKQNLKSNCIQKAPSLYCSLT